MTLPEILSLTPADLNRAIAEAKGWTQDRRTGYWLNHDDRKALQLPDFQGDPAESLTMFCEINQDTHYSVCLREGYLALDYYKLTDPAIGTYQEDNWGFIHDDTAETICLAIARCWLHWFNLKKEGEKT